MCNITILGHPALVRSTNHLSQTHFALRFLAYPILCQRGAKGPGLAGLFQPRSLPKSAKCLGRFLKWL